MLLKFVLALGCVLPTLLNTQSAPAAPVIEPEEYAVYAAALEHFHQRKLASHPIVSDHTSTFACDAGCNGMNIGGCNGLRFNDETPGQRLAIVRRDIPQLDSSVTADFEAKGQRCAEVKRSIPGKIKYLLFGVESGDNPPDGWENPDYFYFSRAAFNQDQTQALIAVGFLSGTDAHESAGKYCFFKKIAGQWRLEGLSEVWKLVH